MLMADATYIKLKAGFDVGRIVEAILFRKHCYNKLLIFILSKGSAKPISYRSNMTKDKNLLSEVREEEKHLSITLEDVFGVLEGCTARHWLKLIEVRFWPLSVPPQGGCVKHSWAGSLFRVWTLLIYFCYVGGDDAFWSDLEERLSQNRPNLKKHLGWFNRFSYPAQNMKKGGWESLLPQRLNPRDYY